MTFRAFFAVDIQDEDIAREISKLQRKIDVAESKIKYVDPKIIHSTMKFLGDIDEKIVPELKEEAEKITFEPFEIELESVGCLPSKQYIRVIYIDISKGAAELTKIANDIRSVSSKFDVKKEKRPFKPHLTIGRVKWIKNKAQLVENIEKFEGKKFGKVMIDNFELKKSVLTPQGPIYSTVFEVKANKK